MANARLIDGKALAAELRQAVAKAAADITARHGFQPGLAAVLVGEDPASEVYVKSKGKASLEAGLKSFEHRLPAAASEAELLKLVARLNADPEVDGILVQMPLPKQIDPRHVIGSLDPSKDVDGFHPANVGGLWSGGQALVPCTPYGCLLLLRRTLGNLAGSNAVVLGRSNVVGKPMAALLLAENCTVTIAHSKSRGLPALARQADILVAALGKPEMVKGSWIKPGAAVIDVGINRVAVPGAKDRLVGDVAFAEASQVAGAISPVPGGVGPMTIACLLRNTLLAACRRRGLPEPAL
jgi:methylenetetrahydrofolate dehydrogenase (NADP+)/methenyltetrahydrofolate cyclohydrolase